MMGRLEAASRALLCVLWSMSTGCAARSSDPVERPPLEWNFVGTSFRDVPAAAAELESKLRLEPIAVLKNFAMLSSNWLDPDWPTWELESRSDGPASLSDLSLAFRLHVAGPAPVASGIAGPEGLRLRRVAADESGPACPAVSRVDLQAWNLAAMEEFYTGMLGLTAAPHRDGIALSSRSRAVLVLVSATDPRPPRRAEPAEPEIWLGFQTPDIGHALRWFDQHAVSVIQSPELGAWGGTDMFVADPDGHPVWIFQDHLPHWLRRFHHSRIFGGNDRACAGVRRREAPVSDP